MPLTLQQHIRKLRANIRRIHANDNIVVSLVTTPRSLKKRTQYLRLQATGLQSVVTQTTTIIIFHVPHVAHPNRRYWGLSETNNH